MNKVEKILILCLLSLMACHRTEHKKTVAEASPAERLDSQLKEVFSKNELIGMSVVLIKNGNSVFEGNYGQANTELNLPVSDKTIFRIASISKSFTAMAVMQLVEQGKLDLDVDISPYLGWKLQHPKHPDKIITARHLLSHTSGIRDGEGFSNFSQKMFTENLQLSELFQSTGKYYTDDIFSSEAPGEYFSYTNCTWGILATVVERISGTRFDEYCREYMFKPMGLEADFNPAGLRSYDHLAALYRFENNQWTSQVDDYKGQVPPERVPSNYTMGSNGLLFGPQGSLRCTAGDLVKTIQMFFNGGIVSGNQILKKESVDLMLSDQWTYNGSNGDTWENFFLSYGLGIHRTLDQTRADVIFPGIRMTGHPGIAYGLLSDMYFDKSSETGVVFITNGSKKSFQYGKNTTFYQVEEDVFEAIYPLLNSF
ncbi:MAG: serine hydrolase [Lutimonas sp.]